MVGVPLRGTLDGLVLGFPALFVASFQFSLCTALGPGTYRFTETRGS